MSTLPFGGGVIGWLEQCYIIQRVGHMLGVSICTRQLFQKMLLLCSGNSIQVRPSVLTFCSFLHLIVSLCHFVFRNLLLQQEITFHNIYTLAKTDKQIRACKIVEINSKLNQYQCSTGVIQVIKCSITSWIGCTVHDLKTFTISLFLYVNFPIGGAPRSASSVTLHSFPTS